MRVRHFSCSVLCLLRAGNGNRENPQSNTAGWEAHQQVGQPRHQDTAQRDLRAPGATLLRGNSQPFSRSASERHRMHGLPVSKRTMRGPSVGTDALDVLKRPDKNA